jgi:arylsulfatase A-like enzyme
MAKRPNILFIMSDDHASHAIGAYGSRINETPNLDRIAEGGMRFDNCFCTNSICTPSRAVILAGTHTHVNGVTTIGAWMDNRLTTYPKLLQKAGYQTALFGKWHLGVGREHCPTGFDEWAVLPGQGAYHDPEFIFRGPDGGERRQLEGYCTDLITDLTIEWLENGRDPDRPFCLMCHHKAPHRPWEPDEKKMALYEGVDIPEPETLYDDYENRSTAARVAKMRVGEDMNPRDVKRELPAGLEGHALRKWAYQYYIKDYLRCVSSVDDGVGRLLDWLDEAGLAEETVVIYTSDQGFFLGDHGWYDKRFMYEESLRMPFLVRYPREIEPGSVATDMVLNLDFAPTFLDWAGAEVPGEFQGRSFRPVACGETPADWRTGMYYRYWQNGSIHNVAAHYGLRTERYKLIYYYAEGLGEPEADPVITLGGDAVLEPEWELFDLERDPREMRSVYDDPACADVVRELKAELHRQQAEVGDTRHPGDV